MRDWSLPHSSGSSLPPPPPRLAGTAGSLFGSSERQGTHTCGQARSTLPGPRRAAFIHSIPDAHLHRSPLGLATPDQHPGSVRSHLPLTDRCGSSPNNSEMCFPDVDSGWAGRGAGLLLESARGCVVRRLSKSGSQPPACGTSSVAP